MSEFDAFESASQQEADPAADFLAREQDQLAELGDDTLTSTGNTDVQQDMFIGEATVTSGSNTGGDDLLAAFDSPAVTTDSKPEKEQDDNIAGVDSEVSDQPTSTVADENPAAPIDDVLAEFDSPAQSGMGMMDAGLGDAEESQQSDMYAAISRADTQRAEPEKIRIWREEQAARLEKKDAEEKLRMEEWRQVARQELEDWYKHRDEQLEKTKISNREGEAAFIKERDETLPGQAWEKICRNCEFNPKNNKSTKDNSRMRSILLQLKQTPLVR